MSDSKLAATDAKPPRRLRPTPYAPRPTPNATRDTTYAAHPMPDKPAKSRQPRTTDITELPGHSIRRLQQNAVAIFLEHTKEHGVTPVQYAALEAIFRAPGLDQRTLASAIRFDTSTIGGVIDRLEKRGLVTRSASPSDRRVRLLQLTKEGERVLALMQPAVQSAQRDILAPLSAAEQTQLVGLIKKILAANESRADGSE